MKKRYIIEILCLILMLVIPFFRGEKEVELNILKETITPYILQDKMEESDVNKIYRSYSLSKEEYDSYVSYSPISYMNVEELTVFEVKDEVKRKEVVKQVKKHIEEEIKIFEGYGIYQTELLKKAYVEEKGTYVICIVHDEVDKIQREIEGVFK